MLVLVSSIRVQIPVLKNKDKKRSSPRRFFLFYGFSISRDVHGNITRETHNVAWFASCYFDLLFLCFVGPYASLSLYFSVTRTTHGWFHCDVCKCNNKTSENGLCIKEKKLRFKSRVTIFFISLVVIHRWKGVVISLAVYL